MCGVAEDESRVGVGQSSQLYPGERAGPLEPAEGLLNQPSLAKRDRVASMPCGSPIEVGAAFLFALLNVRCDIQGTGSRRWSPSRSNVTQSNISSLNCSSPRIQLRRIKPQIEQNKSPFLTSFQQQYNLQPLASYRRSDGTQDGRRGQVYLWHALQRRARCQRKR